MEWAKASNIRKRCFLCIKSTHAKACYWCSGPYILDLHLGWKGIVKKKKKYWIGIIVSTETLVLGAVRTENQMKSEKGTRSQKNILKQVGPHTL